MTIQELETYSPLYGFYNTKDQLKRFIYNRADEALAAGDTTRDKVEDIQGIETRKAYIHEKFMESLGGLPANDTPPVMMMNMIL